MKILLYNVTTAVKVGGVEIFYISIAKELANDHKVTLVSGLGDKLPSNLSNVDIKLFKFIQRNNFPKFGNRFRKFCERISFFINARNFLYENKFDIMVIHKPFDFFVAYLLKKKNKALRVIFVSGCEDFYFFDKFFVKFIDKIISVSNENAKLIERRYMRNVTVVANGVDKARFGPNLEHRESIRNKLGLSKDTLVFGSVGRIVGLKGFCMVIKALQEFENAVYILCGDGNERSKLVNLAKDLNVLSRVKFVGEIPHDELNLYINAMDIYIQPSIGLEAFGITVIEALSCDKVCVVSDNGGMKGIVKDGINGFKFRIGDLIDLVDKIKLAISEKNRLGPRESIKDMYEWKNFTNEITSI